MNNPLFLTFSAIIIVFTLLLIVQSVSKRRFCALCASVSATWISLLILYWIGLFNEPIIIAGLMGGSAVGLYYLVERKTAESLHIFRLPFFLSLLFAIFLLLGIISDVIPLAIIAALWLAFGAVYFWKEKRGFKVLIRHLVECCKNW